MFDDFSLWPLTKGLVERLQKEAAADTEKAHKM